MATLETRLNNLGTRVATEIKLVKTMLSGNANNLNALNTADKTSLVAALNELQTEINSLAGQAGAQINDASGASATETYSVNKILDLVGDLRTEIMGTDVPAALNSLDELAAAIGDDANFAATIMAGLGNRVRVDAAQSFTSPQKAQARANIGADITSAEIGNPDTDFVATFEAGLL